MEIRAVNLQLRFGFHLRNIKSNVYCDGLIKLAIGYLPKFKLVLLIDIPLRTIWFMLAMLFFKILCLFQISEVSFSINFTSIYEIYTFVKSLLLIFCFFNDELLFFFLHESSSRKKWKYFFHFLYCNFTFFIQLLLTYGRDSMASTTIRELLIDECGMLFWNCKIWKYNTTSVPQKQSCFDLLKSSCIVLKF